MIRAIRPSAMAQDDATMLSGWNVAPNLAYTLALIPGTSACAAVLYSEHGEVAASGVALVGTAQPCVLLPHSGQTIGMIDADLGWHLLITTTGPESQRTIRIGPAVDLPDEIHPVYGSDDLAVVRATAAIDAAAHYIDDVTVSCTLGLGALLSNVVSVPVDGVAVVGQNESITWTATPDGTSEQAVVRRHVAIAPAPFVAPVLPSVANDVGTATHITGTSGNVLANDASGLTVTAVNGLSGNVGAEVDGNNGGVFMIASNGAWTFSPDGDFALLSGSETANTSIAYHASNGTAEAMATLTVTVSRANTAPVAVNDTGETTADATTSGNVLTNDTDADGDTLTVSRVAGSPANVGVAVAGSGGGLFTIGSDGDWTFDPNSEFGSLAGEQTATTSVTYHVSDGASEAIGTLTVTVSSAIASDPYWANVSICINAAGADNSLDITEAKGKTVTLVGDTKIKTTLGFPTIYCDGAGDYFYIPYTVDMNMEAGNFTIEFLTRFMNGSGYLFTNAGSYGGYYSYRLSASGAQCFVGGLRNLSFAESLNDGNMHHAVLQRNGSSLQLLADGILHSSVNVGTSAMSYATGRYTFGAYHSNEFSSFHARGVRVTKGVARYAATYAPPVFPFPTV